LFIAEQRIGAQLDQETHERRVVGNGGQKKRRRAGSTQQATARFPGLEPGVHVRSMLNQLPH
jgi:hypothetical protein